MVWRGMFGFGSGGGHTNAGLTVVYITKRALNSPIRGTPLYSLQASLNRAGIDKRPTHIILPTRRPHLHMQNDLWKMQKRGRE